MSPLYIVTWTETRVGFLQGHAEPRTVFYQGWAQQYGEPMWSADPKDALKMSRGGAYQAAKRLRDPKKWGAPDAKAQPVAKAGCQS